MNEEYQRNYYLKNKERIHQQQKEWRKKHKPEILERVKNWRKNNRKKVNRNAAKSAYKRSKEVRVEILKLLGDKCVRCGESDMRCLQIDHVNGGGRQESKRFSNYFTHITYILRQIKAGSKDYQLLCANCNQIKKYESNEQPTSRFAS